MKNLFKLLFAFMLTASVVTACKSDTAEESTEVAANTSENYNTINFATGGDFLNLNVGDSKEEVKTKLESMLLDYEDETALMYLKENDTYEYYLDVYFEEDKLSSIDVMVYYYNEDGSLDLEACNELYEGWKAALTSKLGKTEEIAEVDDTYSVWVVDNKEFNVGADDQRAYFYLYPYED